MQQVAMVLPENGGVKEENSGDGEAYPWQAALGKRRQRSDNRDTRVFSAEDSR